MQAKRTAQQRLSHLEAEMLYTNTRVIEALSDIKKILIKQDERLERIEENIKGLQKRMDELEKRMDGLEQHMGKLEIKVDSLEIKVDDTKKIVTTMQAAQLEKL